MMKTASPTQNPENAWNCLQAYQKAIRFGKGQIEEGELLAGKSMIDSTLKQLERQSIHHLLELEAKRATLITSAKEILQELHDDRKRKLLRKQSALEESGGVSVEL